MEFLILQFLPIPLCPVTPEMSVALSSLLSLTGIYTHRWDSLEPSLLQTEQTHCLLICQMLQFRNDFCSLLPDLLQYVQLSCNEEPRTGNSAPGVSQQWWAEGKDHIPPPAGDILPNAAHNAIVLCCQSILLAHVQLGVKQDPRSISARVLSSWVTLSKKWCLCLFLPRCRPLHFPLLNLMMFLSAYISSLQRSLWMVVHPCGLLTAPSRFVSPVYLWRVHWVPPSR